MSSGAGYTGSDGQVLTFFFNGTHARTFGTESLRGAGGYVYSQANSVHDEHNYLFDIKAAPAGAADDFANLDRAQDHYGDQHGAVVLMMRGNMRTIHQEYVLYVVDGKTLWRYETPIENAPVWSDPVALIEVEAGVTMKTIAVNGNERIVLLASTAAGHILRYYEVDDAGTWSQKAERADANVGTHLFADNDFSMVSVLKTGSTDRIFTRNGRHRARR